MPGTEALLVRCLGRPENGGGQPLLKLGQGRRGELASGEAAAEVEKPLLIPQGRDAPELVDEAIHARAQGRGVVAAQVPPQPVVGGGHGLLSRAPVLARAQEDGKAELLWVGPAQAAQQALHRKAHVGGRVHQAREQGGQHRQPAGARLHLHGRAGILACGQEGQNMHHDGAGALITVAHVVQGLQVAGQCALPCRRGCSFVFGFGDAVVVQLRSCHQQLGRR